MKKIAGITAAVVALSGGAAAGAGAAPAQPPTAAALKQFEGKVASVNRQAHTFRLRDAERGTVTVKVTRTTRFQRLRGFSSLHRGLRRVEATVKRTGGAWVATLVERSGGGGRHGGGNDD